VSQYLIREVAYAGETGSPSDTLFRIVAFRLFSQPTTWDFIVQDLGRQPTIADLASSRFEETVVKARENVAPLYTNAFILCATNAFGRTAKHLNHIELLKLMFVDNEAGQNLLSAKSLSAVYHLLKSFPLLGQFMAYQIAIDLNYSAHINFNENDFTVAGPGALRGIKKAFVSCGGLAPEDVIHWMVDNQEAEFQRLGLDFGGLWGRPLHAIDCQGLFCELDKYCRVAFPELASNRSRIKAKFKPTSRKLSLFFPPKWQITADQQEAPSTAQPVLSLIEA